MRLRLGSIIVMLICTLALGVACSAQTPGTYRIDTHSSRIEIHVFRTGLFGSLGDNHVIGGAKFIGQAVGEKDGSWKIEVHLESASLRVEDAGISDSTRKEIQTTMLGATQLDVGRYPSIDLISQVFERGDAPAAGVVKSRLTLHGVTRQIDFPVRITDAGGSIEVQGQASLRLRDFGIEPISKGLGTVKVKNEFEVVYDIRLHRESR